MLSVAARSRVIQKPQLWATLVGGLPLPRGDNKLEKWTSGLNLRQLPNHRAEHSAQLLHPCPRDHPHPQMKWTRRMGKMVRLSNLSIYKPRCESIFLWLSEDNSYTIFQAFLTPLLNSVDPVHWLFVKNHQFMKIILKILLNKRSKTLSFEAEFALSF